MVEMKGCYVDTTIQVGNAIAIAYRKINPTEEERKRNRRQALIALENFGKAMYEAELRRQHKNKDC